MHGVHQPVRDVFWQRDLELQVLHQRVLPLRRIHVQAMPCEQLCDVHEQRVFGVQCGLLPVQRDVVSAVPRGLCRVHQCYDMHDMLQRPVLFSTHRAMPHMLGRDQQLQHVRERIELHNLRGRIWSGVADVMRAVCHSKVRRVFEPEPVRDVY